MIISPYFIELQIGQKQKGRQWVYEVPIFEVIFVALTENSLVVTNDTQGPPEIADMALQLPQYFYQPMEKILVATSKFGVLTIRWHSATRKHLFLYPQGDRSGLRKPKSKSINTNYSYHQHYLPQPVSIDQTIISDSVLTNSVGKDGVQGWSI